MQRGIPVPPSLAGFFSHPVTSNLQAAKFGPGCRNLSIKNRRKDKCLVPLLAGLCLCALSAQAQVKSWKDATDDWATGTNWNPEGAPIAANDAVINNDGTALVITPGDTARSLTLGLSIQSSGTVNISGNGPASLVISNGATIGSVGIGIINLSNGGTLNTGTTIILGGVAAGSGTLNISEGGGATTLDLVVGQSGHGMLAVQNSGTLMDSGGFVGQLRGSQGTVTVSGAGSTWTNTDTIQVGGLGTGTLTIENGGTVKSGGGGSVGLAAGSTGTVTVTGPGSTWSNTPGGGLSIGAFGTGTLTIANGGSVINDTAFAANIGLGAGSQGTVTVTGPGSTWSNSSGVNVGNFGTGTLTVADGGIVNVNRPIVIAANAGAIGTLNIGAGAGNPAVAPGTLFTQSVEFGAGMGTINFNHTSANYEFAPAISGNGRVNVLAGTTILTGTNTYSGGTTIAAGTLQLGNGRTSGSVAGNIVDNGVLAISRSDLITLAGVVSGTGSLTQLGPGTLLLAGGNTYTGTTTMSGGILSIASGADLGATSSLTFNGGNLLTTGNVTTSLPVILAANGTIDNGGNTDTFSGVFSGTGALTSTGTGKLILTANNTYSGSTTIAVGTLQLGDGGTTGSIIGDVNDKGTLVFNRSGDKKTFDGVISGSGTVVKQGSDILELTANNTYSGGITIEDGVLVAGVPIASTAATSFALGTGNVFLQGGTLRTPSLDPLTINVGRDYTQGPAGTLALGVAGINGKDYDHVQVGGNASLNGTLAVSSLNSFRPVTGNAFEVLHANGSRSGRFAQVNDFLNNDSNLQRFDIYAQNAVVLLYATATTTPAPTPTPTPPPGSAPSPTPNPRPPIDIIVPEPLPPVDPDEPIPPKVLLPFLDPTVEQLTSMFEIPFSASNTQRFNLTDRMTQIQQGSTGFVSPIAPAPAPIPTGKEIGKKEVVPPALVPGPTNRWGVWVNGWGDWVNVHDDNGVKGYNFTTGGVSVGVDYRITDYLAIGLFGTYAHTGTNLNPGSIDVNTGRGGLYVTYWNQGFYINGAVYGGYNSYDTSRGELTSTMANGSTSGYEVSTFVDTGYNFHFGDLSFGPVFAAQYTNVHIDGFTEQGSFLPLNIHSDSEESWRTDLGVRASYACHVGNIIVIPSLWAAWEHEYKYSSLPITFSSVEFPGVSATVFGPHEGHDSAIINAGVGTQWTPRIATYVGYQGQLGRDNYDANGVTGTISFSF